jgi:hypothetical protein
MVDGGNWVADLYSTKLLKDLANSNIFIYQSFWIKILRFLPVFILCLYPILLTKRLLQLL